MLTAIAETETVVRHRHAVSLPRGLQDSCFSAPRPLLRHMARSPLVRPALLVVLAGLLLAPAAARAQTPATASVPATSRAEQVEQLWAFVDRRAAELEGQWRPERGAYVTRGGSVSTRMNANMTAVHALAAIAGHIGPARRDERLAPMVDALTRAPAFREVARRPARATSQFHVPGWTPDAGSYLPLREHVSLDPQAAEGLALAVRARDIVGLPEPLVGRVRHAVHSTANSEFYTWPRQKLNQFNWPADMALADFSVSGDATLLQRDFPQYLNHFLDHAHRRGANRSPNLNDGLGFLYRPDVRPTAAGNRVGTSEYANIVFHGLDDYAPAVAAGMPPLDGKRMWVLQAWARRILTGDWTHAGYLNWDTGLAYRRWHLTRYWVFALGGLSTLAEAPVLDEQAQRWARWMFDRALGYYERLQAGRHTPSIPSTLYGIRSSESDPESDPQFVAARIAGLVAHQALARAADAPAEQPPPLFAYDPGSRRLAVTTPAYSAAVLDQTIRLGYGGVELARLYDGRGHPLGSIGSHDHSGFGVAIARRQGRRLLETQGGHRSARTFRSGKPLRGPFTARTMTARVHGARRTSVQLRRTFLADRIVTTYVLRGPRSAIARIRFPVWSRLSRARRPVVTSPRRGTLALRVRQPAGGYRVIVRSRSRLGTHWRVIRHPPRSSPGTRGVLEVRLRLAHRRATVRVTIIPD